jgi:Barrel-sandwich domain of CusB or HlyD membrane-fusion
MAVPAAKPAAPAPAPAPAAGSSTTIYELPPPHPPQRGVLWMSAPGSGVEDVRPQADQTTGGTTSGGSTTGTSTTGTSTTGTSTAGTSTSSTTAKTSEDPGEAAVRNAQAKLDQDRAARIQAFQATQNLDLVAPEDGTVVSLDGIVGQVAGPQGIVLSSTATGNPAGGRLPDGSAISSGAGSGQSATTGSSTASAAGGAAGGAAASTGSTGASVTAAPSAPAVMTIANLAAMQVLAQVPELDVGKVANGQPVAVSVNALPGQKIPGSVTSINLLPGSQTTVQYGTAVLMPTPPPGMRPGMSASVSITTRQANNVTFLPSVAVTPVGGPDSGQGTVQVLLPDGTTAPRTIGTGLSSDTVTQVTSGLSLGDLVVLPDQSASSAATVRGLRGGGGGGGGGGAGGGGRAGG